MFVTNGSVTELNKSNGKGKPNPRAVYLKWAIYIAELGALSIRFNVDSKVRSPLTHMEKKSREAIKIIAYQ